jgi:hypothetical protein
MKIFPIFYEESGGDASMGGGGAAATLLGGAGASTTTQAASTTTQQDEGGAAAFDFRTLLDDNGGFRQGWETSLPDDLKPKAGSLTKYPNPLELMRGHAKQDEFVGRKSTLTPPAPDAAPEVVSKYNESVRAALGIPPKVEDYKLTVPTLPEGVKVDEAQMKEFTALAHSLNIPPAAAQKFMEFDAKRMAAMNQAGQAQLESFVKSQSEILKTEWGDKMGDNIAKAKHAAGLLGLDINDPQLGNNAAFIKAMHVASGLIQSDKLIGTKDGVQGLAPSAIADDIRNNKANPWHNAYHGREGAERQKEAYGHIKRMSGMK